MWSGEGVRKLREERGVEWCAQIMKGRLPFIGARRCPWGCGEVERGAAALVLEGAR